MSDMLPVTELPPVRIWKMNDCDWVAARTLTSAIDCYLVTTGASRAEVLEDEPRPLSEGEMARLTFTTEVEEPDSPGSLKRHSFAAELKRRVAAGVEFPQFFASTEH